MKVCIIETWNGKPKYNKSYKTNYNNPFNPYYNNRFRKRRFKRPERNNDDSLNPFTISKLFYLDLKETIKEKIKTKKFPGIRYGKFKIRHERFSRKKITGCFVTYSISRGKNLSYYLYPKVVNDSNGTYSKIKQIFVIERFIEKDKFDKSDDENKILYTLKLETVPSCTITLINDIKNKL